jgi:hypothetical protein
VALVSVIASGALAACGSSSGSSKSTSSTTAVASASTSGAAAGGGANSARRAQLVSCLKAHGVTLPSRPAGAPPAGGGTGTGTGTGTSTKRRGFLFGGGRANITPAMRAAFQACGARFGPGAGGGAFRGRISHTAINNFVACVKKNGYPQMPSPNFSGNGPIFHRSVETNAKFQAASRTCSHLLIPSRPSGGSGGSTSTTTGA